MDIVPTADFLPVYAQAQALCHGGPLYDLGYQDALIQQLEGYHLPSQMLFPPPYPPWVVASHAPLCPFSLADASLLFAASNFAMYAIALLLLVAPLGSGWKRLLGLTITASFPPFIGLLTVGQLTIPVILGVGLISSSVRQQRPMRLACGIILLSFKPIPGLLILLFILGYLFTKERSLTRATLPRLGSLAALLAVLSFAIEPHWLTSFPTAAAGVGGIGLNMRCDTCSSVTLAALRVAHLPPETIIQLSPLLMLSAAAAAAVIGWSLRQTRSFDTVLALACLGAVLLPFYIRNYDYCLLAAPILVAIRESEQIWRLLLLALSVLGIWILSVSEREMQGSYLYLAAVLMAVSLWPKRNYDLEKSGSGNT